MERLKQFLLTDVPPPHPKKDYGHRAEYQVVDRRAIEFTKRRAVDMAKAADGCDGVIFLDKGARSLAHLLRRVYPALNLGELPEIRFANVGSEKQFFVDEYYIARSSDAHLRMYKENPFTRQDTVNIFGQENIEELEQMLKHPRLGRNRLIVDDIRKDGTTMEIAEHLFRTLTPDQEYTTFAFIDNQQDYMYDRLSHYMRAHLWGSHGVDDRRVVDSHSRSTYDQSFRVSPEYDREHPVRNKNIKLRQDFDLIAREIAIDHAEAPLL